MEFELTEDFLTGIDQIDREHARLIEIINHTNAILEQDNADIQVTANRLVKELTDYTVTHFRHEEEYMEKINDPELPLQKIEHAAFIKRVKQIPIDDSIKVRDLEEMIQFLVRWLFRHILHSDRMIGKVAPKEKVADPFAFTEKYFTHIPAIDREHKKLFEIIREANDLIHNSLLHDKYDKIIAILEQLREYTETHFAHEEKYMTEIGYPDLAFQITTHTAFIDKLGSIDFNELQSMDDNQQEYLEDLIDYLLNWLSEHILGADKLIGQWEERNREEENS